MRNVLRVAAVVLLLAGCHQTFNNPVDPLGAGYVGYLTVRDINAVRPESPADGATIQWLAFACSLCPAADAYGMELADSAGAVVHTSQEGASNRFVLTAGNLAAGSYTWRVRAHAVGGAWGEWSAAAAVVLDSGITGVSPADAAATADTTPLLDWGDVAGATYEVQIATSAAGLDAATPVAASGSEYQVLVASAFAYGNEVRWRVRAVNADGVRAAWSPSVHFTVQWTVDYGTISPANGSSTSDTTPLLDWGDVTGASYEVQLADGVAGLDAATPVATSGSQYQVPTALAYGTWYWRVCAVNADGVPAAWSTTWSFATAPLVATVSVAGGTFQMGSVGIAEPVHSVTVSSFLIAKYEVTQAQYQTVVGSNPSSFTSGADAPNRPVERVSWYNAVAFCNALSALEGLTACYTTNGTTVTADFTKNGYRLPTEAEWEYAARGRAPGPVYPYTYAGSNDVNSVAWYSSNSGSSTHPVGTKGANELGIYDM